ncbi:MAG: carboxymuconolactone decarboxylase family protein, partial [Thiotrichales bacterium]|nr:carboxymuconolactone decarboxylase family protein [Thiotrichales bacterium]
MPRIHPVNESFADSSTLEILDLVRNKVGTIPNFMSTMANSPAVIRGFLGMSQALSTGFLSTRLREKIALRVSEINKCQYCVSAHSIFARHAGLSDAQTLDARRGESDCEKEKAALSFARKVVIHHGAVTEKDLKQIR